MADTSILICDILAEQFDLPANRIFIYNQDFKVPNDSEIFIVVQYTSSNVISNNSRYVDDGNGGLDITQYVIIKENFDINIASKNTTARDRKEEILFALTSSYSKEVQSSNDFYIATIPTSFVNASEVEGSGMLNRFILSISTIATKKQIKSVDFYETFNKQLLIDK